MLGMTDGAGGILAVRRGSRGSYVLDTTAMDCVWEVPCVSVQVMDPTGKLMPAQYASFGTSHRVAVAT